MPSASEQERRVAPKPFPVRHIAEIEAKAESAQWLVEPLWALAGVGIVAGLPKACKTWVAAELALAVATGGSALGRFPARATGPVLFFGAEDDQPSLRKRFEAIAATRGARLADAPLFLLDIAELRLEQDDHIARLRATVAERKPRLLVLDPFVRIARVDENSAVEVSAVLGSLRAIQRELDVAVLLAHHMRKSPASHLGQQLRGSGDFAAWADSTIYLTRRSDGILLSGEHRGAPAPTPVLIRLETAPVPHLAVVGHEPSPSPEQDTADPLEASLVDHLTATPRPLSTVELRDTLKVRKATVIAALDALRARGVVTRSDAGWTLADDGNTQIACI